MSVHQDVLLDCSARLCVADDWQDPLMKPLVKRVAYVAWMNLSASERRDFINSLDDQNRIIPKAKRAKPSEDLEILTMIRGWQQVIANVTPDDRSFALSIMKRRGNQDWWPSPAQIHKMKTLWAERHVEGGEVEVTE